MYSIFVDMPGNQGRQFLSQSGGYESGKFTVIRGLFSDLVLYYLMYSLDSGGGDGPMPSPLHTQVRYSSKVISAEGI